MCKFLQVKNKADTCHAFFMRGYCHAFFIWGDSMEMAHEQFSLVRKITRTYFGEKENAHFEFFNEHTTDDVKSADRCFDQMFELIPDEEKLKLFWMGLVNYNTDEDYGTEEFAAATFAITDKRMYVVADLGGQLMITISELSTCSFYDLATDEFPSDTIRRWDGAALGFNKVVYFVYERDDKFTNRLKRTFKRLKLPDLNTPISE